MQGMIIIGGYLLIALYALTQVDRHLKYLFRFNIFRFFFDLVFLIPTLVPLAAAVLPDTVLPVEIRNQMLSYSNYWLGFFVYFTGLLFLLHVFRIISIPFRDAEERKRHNPLIAGFALLLCIFLSLSINIYGKANAQHLWLTKYSVNISKVVTKHGDMRIVLASDFHLGVNSKPSLMQKMVNTINEQDADVVIIAGDIFNADFAEIDDPQQYIDILKGLESKNGVYIVYGNHDVASRMLGGFNITDYSQQRRSKEMDQFVEDCGFTVLDDKVVILGGVQIAGRIDGEVTGTDAIRRATAKELLGSCDVMMPVIVVEHEPLDFKALRNAGADLVLSGHTHAGQIFPGNIITRFLSRNHYGFKTVSGCKSLVTSGVGYYGPPIRVGTHSEVVSIDITY